MTRILAALLLAALAAAMACGRRGSDVVTVAALLEAESLLEDNSDETGYAKRMLHNADSALCVLRTIDTAALATDGDRALYALLLTQALYKQPNPQNLDTVPILEAVTYYAATAPGSKRHVHALTYAGAAAETNGDISGALYKYKMAELWSDTSQHFDIGYVDMKIANIYHRYTLKHSTTIRYYRQAIDQFTKANHYMFWEYCLSDLGAIYRATEHQDSALHYLLLARDSAAAHRDTFMIIDTETYLVGYYEHIKDYESALQEAHKIKAWDDVYENYPLVSLMAAFSHAKLHNADSAAVYLSMAKLSSVADSAKYYETMSCLAAENGDSIEAKLYLAKCDYINDNHIIRQSKKININAESLAVIDRLEYDEAHANVFHKRMIAIIAITAFIAIAIIVITFRRIAKMREARLKLQLTRLNTSLEQAKTQLLQAKTQLNNLESQNPESQSTIDAIERLCNILVTQYELMRTSLDLTTVSKGNRASHNNLNDFKIIPALGVDEAFWRTAVEIVNALYPDAISHAHQAMPDMNSTDNHFLLLKCLKFPDHLVCALVGMTNIRSADNKSRRINRMLCPTQHFNDWLQAHSALRQINS